MNQHKKISSFLVLIFFSFITFAQNLPKKPEPPRLVNDYTNTLTEDQQQSIERKLVAFDDSTSTQIAVVIVQSLDGYDVAEYNVALGRAWGVGGKQYSNGVILLISKDDRKLNIATGYGVEGALPDITSKHIIEDVIVPNFKGNDYYRGIDEGTDAIIKAVKGEYKVPRTKSTGGWKSQYIFIIIIILMLVIGSSGGGRSGGFMSRRGSIIGPMILSNLLGGGGGSGGGSSGGGGGFGGFGGGSFGGGGASGSW